MLRSRFRDLVEAEVRWIHYGALEVDSSYSLAYEIYHFLSFVSFWYNKSRLCNIHVLVNKAGFIVNIVSNSLYWGLARIRGVFFLHICVTDSHHSLLRCILGSGAWQSSCTGRSCSALEKDAYSTAWKLPREWECTLWGGLVGWAFPSTFGGSNSGQFDALYICDRSSIPLTLEVRDYAGSVSGV